MPSALPIAELEPEDGLLPDSVAHGARHRALGAYVHVPFCVTRCGYCDFNTYTAEELGGQRRNEYAGTVLREIVLARRVLDDLPRRAISTVFFGGGTPTLLPAGDIAALLAELREHFDIAPHAEVTVEANPDTVTQALVDSLATAGVTRLSLGVQSTVPQVLRVLDRTHRPENVRAAITSARKAGLQVSVDLIYGAPGESLADWKRSVDEIVQTEPDHVSAYALIVEPGTALARRIARGELEQVDDDLAAEKYEYVDQALSTAGFDWYEISNWARGEGYRSRHNLGYWRSDDWWGFGPGAHSHIGGVRFWNVKHPAAYADRLNRGLSPAAGRESLGAHQRRVENVLLRSRLSEGVALQHCAADATVIAGLVADGLLDGRAALTGQAVLTLRGRLLADVVARALTP